MAQLTRGRSRRSSNINRRVGTYKIDSPPESEDYDPDGASPRKVRRGDDDEDFEFDEEAAALLEEEDNVTGSEDGDANVSVEEDDEDQVEEPDDGSIVGDPDDLASTIPRTSRRAGLDPSLSKSLPSFDPRALHSKHLQRLPPFGVFDQVKRGSKATIIKFNHGPADEDVVPFIKGRDKWRSQPTLPTRLPDKDGVGGMRRSFHHSDDMYQREKADGWKWYVENGGHARFGLEQASSVLSPASAVSYIPYSKNSPQNILLGPLQKQHLFSLASGDCLSVEQAFQSGHVDSSGSSWRKSNNTRSRRGWVLNAGAKVQCLGWVSNQAGQNQYLAISVLPRDPMKDLLPPTDKKEAFGAPAYSRSSYSASLQIWHFRGSSDPARHGHIDVHDPPWLDTVLCFDWGDVKQFEWCRMPTPDSVDSGLFINRHLGLLAGVWMDGSVRVLDVELPQISGRDTQYRFMGKTAFKCILPDTVPSCITWLSTTSIAVGCANGFVAIWHLPSHLTGSARDENPKPWFYSQIHSSYVLSMVSSYPSRPHILTTSCIDGHCRITDLRAPGIDFYTPQRMRRASANLSWHELCQSVILTDESDLARSYPIRTPYNSVETLRLTSGSLGLATSPVHPSLLIAQFDGSVVATQPFERINSVKANTYRQVWFQYSWRRALNTGSGSIGDDAQTVAERRAEDVEMADVNGDEQAAADCSLPAASNPTGALPIPNERVLAEPLGRFLEGQKVERVGGIQVSSHKDSTWHHTIYEAETGICRVAWNPNVEYGGWAAAGTGSGLVRVDDLAV